MSKSVDNGGGRFRDANGKLLPTRRPRRTRRLKKDRATTAPDEFQDTPVTKSQPDTPASSTSRRTTGPVDPRLQKTSPPELERAWRAYLHALTTNVQNDEGKAAWDRVFETARAAEAAGVPIQSLPTVGRNQEAEAALSEAETLYAEGKLDEAKHAITMAAARLGGDTTPLCLLKRFYALSPKLP